jgi:ribosome maturation factor RimP
MSWQAVVERTVTGLGYDLVDVERAPGGLMQVFIDHPAGKFPAGSPSEFITVDDCERVTRQLQTVLEVEAVAYERLEVSSPGLDRPLKKPADYARFVGDEIEIALKQPFEGRRKFRGVLTAAEPHASEAVQAVAPAARDEAAATAPSASAQEGAATSWRLVFNDGKVDQALDFSLEEVRDARLVPVVDFKGRRFAPVEPADSAPAATDATALAKNPGGLDQ